MKKINPIKSVLLYLLVFLCLKVSSQVPGPLEVGGNEYAFFYDDAPNYGLFFSLTNTRYEFTNSLADRVFSVDANSGNAWLMGNLEFGQGGDLLIGSDRYAFRAKDFRDYGLLFSLADLQYQFKTSGQNDVFTIHANEGDLWAKGDITADGVIHATDGSSDEWNEAYNWGDHSLAGYLAPNPSASQLSSGTVSGSLYDFQNSSAASGAMALALTQSATEVANGSHYGLYTTSAAGDTTADPFLAFNTTIHSVANGASRRPGANTFNTALRGIASAGSPSGSTINRAVWAQAGGIHHVTNYGVYAEAIGNTAGINYGVYSVAHSGASNWAGWFSGDLKVTDDLVVEGVLSGDGSGLTNLQTNAIFETNSGITSNAGGDFAGDDFVFGSPQLNYTSILQQNSRMYFDKSKSAFRAGYNSDNSWNQDSTGMYSVSFGGNTNASGDYSIAMGQSATAKGNHSSAVGYFTTANGFSSTALGNSTIAESYAETVIGRFNTNYTPASILSWNQNDRLFVIGNGTSNILRSDALVVLKNGKVGIGKSVAAYDLDVDGHINFTGNLYQNGILFGNRRMSPRIELPPKWSLASA